MYHIHILRSTTYPIFYDFWHKCINLTDFNVRTRRCILILIIDIFYFKNKMLGTSYTLSISKNIYIYIFFAHSSFRLTLGGKY
jgi:hypothetical protein